MTWWFNVLLRANASQHTGHLNRFPFPRNASPGCFSKSLESANDCGTTITVANRLVAPTCSAETASRSLARSTRLDRSESRPYVFSPWTWDTCRRRFRALLSDFAHRSHLCFDRCPVWTVACSFKYSRCENVLQQTSHAYRLPGPSSLSRWSAKAYASGNDREHSSHVVRYSRPWSAASSSAACGMTVDVEVISTAVWSSARGRKRRTRRAGDAATEEIRTPFVDVSAANPFRPASRLRAGGADGPRDTTIRCATWPRRYYAETTEPSCNTHCRRADTRRRIVASPSDRSDDWRKPVGGRKGAAGRIGAGWTRRGKRERLNIIPTGCLRDTDNGGRIRQRDEIECRLSVD